MKLLIGSFAKLIALVVANLPRRAQLALGRFVGWLWFDVLKIRRRIAIDNVGIAFPELSEKERTQIARDSLTSMGQTLIEYFLFPFLNERRARELFELEGEEYLILSEKDILAII